MVSILPSVLVLFLLSGALFAQGGGSIDGFTPVIQNLDNPWAVLPLSEDSFLISEKPGRVLLYQQGKLQQELEVPQAQDFGQGGLLDLAVTQDFPRDPRVFFTATVGGPRVGYGTALGVFTLTGQIGSGEVTFGEPIILWEMEDGFKTNRGQHFGSRLVITQDSVYMTIGDRGQMNRAQLRNDPAGSVLRFSLPTLGTDGRGEVSWEFFSFGHRNAQGLAKRPDTDQIWLHEHGPRGGDELNLLEYKANYGWPLVTFGVNYDGSTISRNTHGAGITPPVTYWVPSIAPSGLAFYDSDAIPAWQDSLFIGALAGQHLRRVQLEGDRVIAQEVLFEGQIGRVRDVRFGSDGYLYVLTDGNPATLYRLTAYSAD
jgi:glucose/arabinose dehydrogenase